MGKGVQKDSVYLKNLVTNPVRTIGQTAKNVSNSASSVGRSLKTAGETVGRALRIGRGASAVAAEVAEAEVAAEVGVAGSGAAEAGVAGAGAAGAGAVVAGAAAVAAAVAGAGVGFARLGMSRNCHKLCAGKFTQMARNQGLTGKIKWDDVDSSISGILSKRTCHCTYRGNLGINQKTIDLNQQNERGPLGKIYKEMCKQGRQGKQGLFGWGLLPIMKPGQCDPSKTVCLRGAPRACVYAMADD